MNFRFLIVLLLFVQGLSFAQNPMLNSSNKKAMKSFEEGMNFYAVRRFDEARDAWEKAVKLDPNFVNAHVFLSKIYKQIYFDKGNWIKHVEISANLAPNSRELLGVYFDYGKFLFAEEDYEGAIKYLDLVLQLNPPMRNIVEEATMLKTEANFGKEEVKKPMKYETRKLNKNINKAQGNYFPTLTADNEMLLYTILKIENRKKDENLMVSRMVDGEWTESVSISKNINTPFNREGASTISGDGKTMVFTKCGADDGFGSCDLYESTKEGNNWSIPVNLGESINGKSWDSNPSLSADGRVLYFSSDRRSGSYGKKDIWISYKIDTSWSAAVNAGNQVNTEEMEISPFIHANGRTLYYSSTGNYEKNMGGFDFFKFDIINKTDPENLGYPVNTAKDETTLFITSDGKKGYYSKDEAVGIRDMVTFIYEFDVPESVRPSTKTNYVKGNVYDLKSNEKLKASIEVFDLKSNELVQKVSSDKITGDFLATLNEGGDYGVYVSKKGYLHESINFNYTESKEYTPEALKIGLKKIESGISIILNNIFFESGSYKLDDKSKSELNKLVAILNDSPLIKVEVSGHTDNVGNEKDNLLLSDNRAKAVREYLISSGISDKRILSKGYGEAKPIVSNDSDINKAMNRRIEFRVL